MKFNNELIDYDNIYNQIKIKIFNYIYPVGSIYMSINSTSPQTLFGGTWTQLKGGYLYAGNSFSQTSYTGIGTQGHTLSIAEMPSHSHVETIGEHIAVAGSSQYIDSTQVYGEYNLNTGKTTINRQITLTTGNSNSHSHNIASIQIYVWRRIS